MHLECDACGSSDDYEGDWMGCLSLAKIDGWIQRIVMGKWFHICSRPCLEEPVVSFGTLFEMEKKN